MPPAWAACMDVGGRYSGTVSGAMNMMGSIAGGCSPLVVGYLLAWTSRGWIVTFYVSAAIYLMGARLLAVSRHADADRRAHHGTPCRCEGATSPARQLAHDDRIAIA